MKFKIEYTKNDDAKSVNVEYDNIQEAIIYFLKMVPDAKITQIWELKFQEFY